MRPIGTIIVGVSRNGVMGKDNSIPWKYPADLKRFRELTTGGTIIMGRKTYESIGRALPKRRNIVISKTKVEAEDIETWGSLEHAASTELYESYSNEYPRPVWYIGGRGIYAEALKFAEAIDLTIIPETIERTGDVVDFPWINPTEFTFANSECGAEGLTHIKYIRNS